LGDSNIRKRELYFKRKFRIISRFVEGQRAGIFKGSRDFRGPEENPALAEILCQRYLGEDGSIDQIERIKTSEKGKEEIPYCRFPAPFPLAPFPRMSALHPFIRPSRKA
jgi:hypothetical protein